MNRATPLRPAPCLCAAPLPTAASPIACLLWRPSQGIVGTWERQSAYVRWALEALDAPPPPPSPRRAQRSARGGRCAAGAPAGGSPGAVTVHPLRRMFEADAAERRRLAATEDSALLASGALPLPIAPGVKHRRARAAALLSAPL